MASNVDWGQVLKDRFYIFKVEENAFLQSLDICNSSDVAAQKIYETIRNDSEIPANLKLMYKEFLFGTHVKVKKRIKSRISNMRRNFKQVFLCA